MRETLFRGRRLDSKQWTQGFFFQSWEHTYILWGTTNGAPNMIEVDPDTVGQYTGLNDKNGKRIFEGDIVKCISLKNDHNQRGARTISAIEYVMGNTCLAITQVPYYPLCITHDITIIGNVHDNPELLGDKL